MNEDPASLRRLLHEALQKEGPERTEFLNRECGTASQLRSRVEELLSAAVSKPKGPPDDLTAAVAFAPEPVPPPPEGIDGYELGECIGAGGMGLVYRAQQQSPRRQVAVKILRSPLSSPEAQNRFSYEAEVLGRLRHPGIASIYDAGTFESGRGRQPFFAMEFVEGCDLLEHSNKLGLGPRDRVRLMVEICDAIQHAHENGVVHRDLKPANLLVDDSGAVKVLDFGVARVIHSDTAENTRQTATGQVVGTIAYMSPEQATGNPIDPRCDVYSLGVVAYELMTGEMPYDTSEASLQESLRIISEDEPAKLGTSSFRYRGDIETIVSKALEKDPERRYRSAGAMGADFSRYLREEPIVARAPSSIYQLTKFVRRNRGLVAAVTTAFLLLIAGLVGTGYGLVEMEKARKDALALGRDLGIERDQADDHRTEILRLADIKRLENAIVLTDALWPADPGKVEDLEAWLRDHGHPLRDNLPQHEATLATLRLAALEYTKKDAEQDRRLHPRAGELAMKIAGREQAQRGLAERETLGAWENETPEDNVRVMGLIRESLVKLAADIAELESVVSQRLTYRFDDVNDQWQHDTLMDLVRDMKVFLDPDPYLGTLASVEKRLAFARDLEQRSRTGPSAREAWAKALAEIRVSDIYGIGAKQVTPQLGLYPLGADPRSKLQEFLHLATHQGEIPARNDEGNFEINSELGVVLVLIPGGAFLMGSERASLGVDLEQRDSTIIVKTVAGSSLGAALGLQAGDVLLQLNDADIPTPETLNGALAPLGTGDRIALRVRRGEETLELTGEVGPNIDPQTDNLGDESPTTVTLSPYFLSKYEMTQGQWKRATGVNPAGYRTYYHSGRQNQPYNPVEQVSWDDCMLWLPRLGLELPTEAQWERGARGGTATSWWCGQDAQSIARKNAGNLADAWAKGLSGDDSSGWPYEEWLNDGNMIHTAVGSYAPNPYGIHDVIGNVGEWCRDGYWRYDVKDPGPGDGVRPIQGSVNRVVRGGCYAYDAAAARSACRNADLPQFKVPSLGVRPARRID